MKSWRVWLGLILLLALIVRIGWAWRQPTNPAGLENLPDQREYLELGQNLLEGRGFYFVDPRFGQAVHAFRTPGYPAFVAACGANLRAIRLAQAVLDTSTVLAVFLLARRWVDDRGALFAAAIVVVNPFLIYFSGLILSESLFVALLAWGMVLARSRYPIAGWIVLAVMVLVRPSAILLPIVIALLAPMPLAQKAKSAAIAAVVTLVVLLPWAIRNQRVTGRWIWTTTNGGITLYDGFNPQADGSSAQEKFVPSLPDSVKQMGEVERNDYFQAEAKTFIRENPGRSLVLGLRKIARTWSPWPLSEQYGKPLYILVGLIYSLPLDVLVVLGLVKSRVPRAVKAF